MENAEGINKVVIVGAGQAGAQAAISLRQGGFPGEITIIGEEEVLPYQRPPLSKAYMKGEMEKERLYLRPEDWYAKNNVRVILGERIIAISPPAKTVEDGQGGVHSFDRLILATGARPRPAPFPGAGLDNVFDLRTLSDVEKVRPELMAGRKLVIIGAGYIGLEAAAVARGLGLDVCVIEAADRVLARVTSPTISEFYQTVHEAEGVKVLTNEVVNALTGDDRVQSVALGDGREIEADIVLIGIGVLPNDDLAREAGIDCDNGVLVDPDAKTSDQSVYAIGDCAHRPLVYHDGSMRLESVHNAIEQGKLAAASILGEPRPVQECPWFWSDQYDIKLQIAGLSGGHDQLVVRGAPESRKFSVFYLKNGQLIAVDAINSPPEFLMAKKMIAAGVCPSPEQLADVSISMKDIASQ